MKQPELKDAATGISALSPGMGFLVTGGTGFIGSKLCRLLVDAGHGVIVLTRDIAKAERKLGGGMKFVDSLDALPDDTPCDVVVNLAGESLTRGRWTAAKKQRLLESRTGTTRAVVRFIERLDKRPGALVSGSAVGFYGPCEDERLDEGSAPHQGFTHDLCEQWEKAARVAERAGTRVCLLRTGIVLDTGGGALAQMLPAFIPMPGFVLRLLFGEMAATLLLRGQRVLPEKALATGYVFLYPELEEALGSII